MVENMRVTQGENAESSWMSKMSQLQLTEKAQRMCETGLGTECSFWCSIVKSLLLSRTLSFKQWGWVT